MKNYQYIRDAYKYTAGLDPVGNLVSIGGNSFKELMQSCGGFVDSKFGISDLDLERVAVKWDSKKNHKMIPPDRLIRYNFLEIFIRMS